MKLLIIHNRYQSNNIGGEDIVFGNELSALQELLGEENVLSYEVSNDEISKLKLLFTIWFSFEHYQKIKKIVQEEKIDIVHVHNFFPLLTPAIFKAAKKGGAKVVHTLHNYRLWCISGILYRDGYGICELCVKKRFSLHGVVNKCYRKSLSQSLVAQLAFLFYKATKVFDFIDYFFVLTNFQKEKITLLGVDEDKIILKPNSLRLSLDIQKEKQDYIYVGRLEESKGIYELLKVWSNLDAKYRLIVVGGGDVSENLRLTYERENIFFKGKCTQELTLKYISKSKYLIQPSLWYETFGLTIMEAMSFGVPVIGFDIGTRVDFIEDGFNGFLSKKEDLQTTIEKSFDYKEYDSLSKNAMESAKLYENSFVISKQIEIYKKILENKI